MLCQLPRVVSLGNEEICVIIVLPLVIVLCTYRIGTNSLLKNTTGFNNFAIGSNTLSNLLAGNNNIIIGYNTGNNYMETESNNIVIGNGNPGTVGESNITRISYTSTNSTQITGIRGVTVSGGIPVFINSQSQLGTSTSSRRFKENIKNVKYYDISNLKSCKFQLYK